MKDLLAAGFIIFLIFQDIILNIINIPYINYWDEAVFILILLLFVLTAIQNALKMTSGHIKVICCLAVTIFIGVLGNLFFSYQGSGLAIIMDIVGYSKFPLTYITFRELNYDKKFIRATNKYVVPFIKLSVIIMFVLGLITIFWDTGLSNYGEVRYGFYTYRFLFTHPTSLVIAGVFIFCILNINEKKRENLFFEILITCVIIFTFRAKGIAIIGCAWFIKYYKSYISKHKIITVAFVVLIAFLLGLDQLQLYASYSGSARASLYSGSFQLARDCFPFGSGFATFASHISAKREMRSLVYSFITIPGGFINGEATPWIGDTGYPYYLGQLGIIGFIFFGLVLYNIFKEIMKSSNNMPAYCLFLYILIAMTTETTLLNYGVEIGIILSVLLSMGEEKRIIQKKHIMLQNHP